MLSSFKGIYGLEVVLSPVPGTDALLSKTVSDERYCGGAIKQVGQDLWVWGVRRMQPNSIVSRRLVSQASLARNHDDGDPRSNIVDA